MHFLHFVYTSFLNLFPNPLHSGVSSPSSTSYLHSVSSSSKAWRIRTLVPIYFFFLLNKNDMWKESYGAKKGALLTLTPLNVFIKLHIMCKHTKEKPGSTSAQSSLCARTTVCLDSKCMHMCSKMGPISWVNGSNWRAIVLLGMEGLLQPNHINIWIPYPDFVGHLTSWKQLFWKKLGQSFDQLHQFILCADN